MLATVSERGAAFRSLADVWADTTTPHGRLMVTVLAGLAEFERSLILARTGDGRARAQARGVRFGRKPKLTAHQIAEAMARRANGEALADIGRSFNVSHSTSKYPPAEPGALEMGPLEAAAGVADVIRHEADLVRSGFPSATPTCETPA